MGEKVTVEALASPATRALTKAMSEALKPLSDHLEQLVALGLTNPRAVVADHTVPPYADVEPWMTDAQGATGGTDRVAFLDDRASLRWVPAGDVGSVPAGWRPLLVGLPVRERS